VAMKAGKRRALGTSLPDRILERIEQLKASVQSRVEHAFRVLKRQFGYLKVRYRGLAQEYRAAPHAVCLGQCVSGTTTIDDHVGEVRP